MLGLFLFASVPVYYLYHLQRGTERNEGKDGIICEHKYLFTIQPLPIRLEASSYSGKFIPLPKRYKEKGLYCIFFNNNQCICPTESDDNNSENRDFY